MQQSGGVSASHVRVDQKEDEDRDNLPEVDDDSRPDALESEGDLVRFDASDYHNSPFKPPVLTDIEQRVADANISLATRKGVSQFIVDNCYLKHFKCNF